MSVRSASSDCGPTWHTPRVLGVLLLVFLCGAAAGALAMRMFASRVPAAAAWSAGAEALVTGDRRHFGSLMGREVRGLWVVSPAEALAGVMDLLEGKG